MKFYIKRPRAARAHLDVVCVPGTVDVAIVALVCRVLDGRRVDGDPSRALLRRPVNLIVRAELRLLLLR